MSTNRIFSGIQPTGNLHLGNYLGAIKNWVKMQNGYECIFCIVDLHAITVPQNPESLRDSIRQTAAAYIASGIDPKKHIIFQQSTVPGHSELAWLLGTLTPFGWLSRMTQFKEKAHQSREGTAKLLKEAKKMIKEIQKGRFNTVLETEILSLTIQEVEEDIKNASSVSLGLFAYPVLMAADILLYKATHVPVGEDQKQHLELARDIAGAFNRQFNNEYFTLPEPVIQGEATRVMSLRDGTKKMSKSDASEFSRIHLSDDVDTIRQKIQKAKSDMEPGITYDVEKRPEASNLLTMYAAIQGKARKDIEAEVASLNFSQFKGQLADALINELSPIRTEMAKLMNDKGYLDALLKENADKANAIASVTMREVQKIFGLL